jgi:hypothetical protein
MTRFPDEHFSAAVLCNFADTDPSALVRQVADIVLAKDIHDHQSSQPTPNISTVAPAKAAPLPPLTTEEMAAIAGNYWDGQDQFAKVIIKDGNLLLDVNRDDFHELVQFAPGHFHVAGESWGNRIDLHFIAGGGPNPRRLEESFDSGKPQNFQLVDPGPLTDAQLAEYAGDYVSGEIDPVYRMVVDNHTIYLTRLKHGPDGLRPAVKDVFVGDIGKITFTRDASQHINGFIFDGDRIENFHFTKRTP